ncbi:hypothetical protein QZH41_020667 [Actinostola sp. cb2023]|nr:hypothetical protein QZH41_020667 [Actinostola sp. cb2023]
MSKQPAPRRPKTGSRGHLPTGDLIALGTQYFSSHISPIEGTQYFSSHISPIEGTQYFSSHISPIEGTQYFSSHISPIEGTQYFSSHISPIEGTQYFSSHISPIEGTQYFSSHISPIEGTQYFSSHISPIEGTQYFSSHISPIEGTQYFSSHISPIEVNPSDLERLVSEAEGNGDRTRIDGLLLGAIKTLKTNKLKPDPMGYLGLLCLAKWKPEIFVSTRVVEALTSLLKRDVLNIKANKTAIASLVPIMAANILLCAYQDIDDWPESFVKVYVEDSLGDRMWVDSDACQSFVNNILTAFGTKRHPKGISRQSSDPGSKSTSQGELGTPTCNTVSATSTAIFMPSTSKEDEEVVVEEMDLSSNEDDITSLIPRFTSPSAALNVSTYFLEIIQDQLTRRQPVENISRNLLRLLMSACGYGQVRLLVSQRIEMWLLNPKLTRPAQDLLMSLSMNCNSHNHEDVEVISNLIRMRFKTKLLANHYVSCVRELIGQHSDNLATVLKHVVYNELSTTRNPNNMSLLATMFQYKPEGASKLLAMVFQDLLMNKDDYLRACRALLREIVRFLRYGLNFVALCRGFMQERTDAQFKDLDGGIKERMFTSLTDLITMATMLSISPAVKDRSTAFARGDTKVYQLIYCGFICSLQKVLYLEPIDSYSTKDTWPQETDKSLFYSLASEVPVQEDTLMRIIIMGLSSELPLNAPEALDMADRIVRRAAAVKTGLLYLHVYIIIESFSYEWEVVTLSYKARLEAGRGYPELITDALPAELQGQTGSRPWVPRTDHMLYQLSYKARLEAGRQSGWDNFPMLKSLMEMIMTNNCVFPPPTIASTNEEKEQMIAQDMQLVQIEKEEILQFESHLAAATTGVNITESNSLLLRQLITMDPVGPARRPPQSFMDELKATNNSLKLGQKLCRSRSPDFLLDIIQRQGTSQSMPWLAELVQSSEGSLDVLPVQCLCEFLLMEQTSAEKADEDLNEKKMNNQKHVLSRLRCLLMGPSDDGDATVEVLEYFMRRLSSGVTKERNAAAKGLELVLAQDSSTKEAELSVVSFSDDVSMVTAIEEMSYQENSSSTVLSSELKWLLVHLPRLPHFETVRPICCFALRQCCQVEIAPERLQAYLVFLSNYTGGPSEEDFTEALLEISQLIIARPTIFNQVLEGSPSAVETYQALLGMYHQAVQHAIDVQENSYFESNIQDQLFAQWSKDTVHAGKAATMHALVIQASILLLTWPEPTDNPETYQALLDSWCPDNGHIRVYLTDTGEEALLLPEWLRLRMIRAASHRVVDAAISDLAPSQLVLFAQSFGIPVYGMSKLLQQLDLAAQEDSMSVNESVLDTGYMLQLVEVQQHRGAEGGDLFCSLLADEPEDKHEDSTLMAEEGHISPLLINSQQSTMARDRPVHEWSLPVEHLTNDLIQVNKHTHTRGSWSEVLISSLLKSANVCMSFFQLLKAPDPENIITKALHKKSNFLCAVIRLLMARQNALQGVDKTSSSFPELIKTLSSRCSQGGPLTYTVHQYKKQLGITTEKSKKASAFKILKEISQKECDESLVRRFILEAKRSEPEMMDKETAIRGVRVSRVLLYIKRKIHLEKASGITLRLSLIKKKQFDRNYSWRCFGLPVDVYHIPRLWQGREQRSTVQSTGYGDTVILLTPAQTCHVARLVLAEVEDAIRQLCHHKGEHFIQSVLVQWVCSLMFPFHCVGTMGHCRMSPFHCSVGTMGVFIVGVGSMGHCVGFEDVCQQTTLVNSECRQDVRWPKWLRSPFLVHLYLAHPHIFSCLENNKLLFTSNVFTKATQCQLDGLCHYTLTVLADCRPGREYEDSANISSLLCRKIASTHPMLFLRHISMISCLLRGRVHLTSKEFSNNQHLLLFSHVLGILDMLRPHVFKPDKLIEDGLQEILDVYFELVQSPCLGNKELAGVISKFTEFLYQFCTSKPEQSFPILQANATLLNDLLCGFPDMPPLKCLVSALSVPSVHTIAASLPTGSSKFHSLIMPLEISSWTPAQLAPVIQRLSPSEPLPDVLKALVDLDETSKRRVDILQHFLSELVQLTNNPDSTVRTKAHTLMQRHIRQHPREAHKFVGCFMECLSCTSPDVTLTAAKFTPEFIVLCCESSSLLLQKLFSVAVNERINLVPSLTRSIHLLNLEFSK